MTRFWWRAFFFCFVSFNLSNCDLGPEARQLGGGYRLKRVGEQSQYALTIPHQSGGMIIDEIGWQRPFIIARASGDAYWIVIDTDHAERKRISDTELKSDARFQKITTEPVNLAWDQLDPKNRLW